MTLIAAYRHKGIPVLIGDMALSKGELRSLRKKVYVINNNFAVGWTGYSMHEVGDFGDVCLCCTLSFIFSFAFAQACC